MAFAIVGAACRLPSAETIEDFWGILKDARNVVCDAPLGRWNAERFLRPGQPTSGFAYTFAGGYLEDPLRFDPAPFGVSPREAQQTDPQQRILLETVWRSFEDAGIRPSSLADEKVGVYVGASNVDYQTGASHDVSVIGSHFMTGNSLSIISNRISYVFDLKGPSLTVDTACSSSFFALHAATEALGRGEIDLAIVGGVNLLLSPTPFIGFSQARMLSPTGRSRPFSAKADGYVRAEGAVVILLRRMEDARTTRVRSVIVGASVNADGRTSGIALPSVAGQRRLIADLYDGLAIDPDHVSFVEAHGTGTRVGDPVEATAIGEALAGRRAQPLLIGSAKSNFGHLEPVSGLVGLLKASLALERGELPPSVFSDEPNPEIDFGALNLQLAQSRRELQVRPGHTLAGVCNYGFGGTNAHVVLRAPDRANRASRRLRRSPAFLIASAASEEALREQGRQIVAAVAAGRDPALIAGELGQRRDLMAHRVVVPLQVGSQSLEAFVETGKPGVGGAVGYVSHAAPRMCFVYSGNGCQFLQMGRAAYEASEAFRAQIAEIDELFAPAAGWSLAQALDQGIDADRLALTSVAQPLIFAIQSALTRCLADLGIRPAAVLGHSVGEVAAAEAAGAISRADAVHVIIERSLLQEEARGLGRMMVAAASVDVVAGLIAASPHMQLEIGAINGPSSTTVVGPAADLLEFAEACRSEKIATVALDVDYPFHSSALAAVEGKIRHELADIAPREGSCAFVSTVEGRRISGARLGADYWWRNIRQPVLFQAAVEAAAREGANLFIEVSPRAILTSTIQDILRGRGAAAVALPTLSSADTADSDPVAGVITRLIAHGASFDERVVLGEPTEVVGIAPPYPFQRAAFALERSTEALSAYGALFDAAPLHPLLGARLASGSPEWRNLLDPVRVPYLRDHQVGGAIVTPAAALIEMALAAGRDVHGDGALELDEFDVFRPLTLSEDVARETSVRYASQSGTVEVWSRARFAGDEWILHARGVLRKLAASSSCVEGPDRSRLVTNSADEVYAEARRAGLQYGPHFQLVRQVERDEDAGFAHLNQPMGGLGAFADVHVVHPASLDAALHGLFVARPQRDGETKAHLPVRFRNVRIWRPGAAVGSAITRLIVERARSKAVAVSLMDDEGRVVASIDAVVLRSVYLSKASVDDRTFRSAFFDLASPQDLSEQRAAVQNIVQGLRDSSSTPRLLVKAFCRSLAQSTLRDLIDEAGASTLTQVEATLSSTGPAREIYEAVLDVASEAGVIVDGASGLQLIEDADLPAPDVLLSTLMVRAPEASLEIFLAASALAKARRILRGAAPLEPSSGLRRRFSAHALHAKAGHQAVAEALRELRLRSGRPWRVLAPAPIGVGLLRRLAPLCRVGAIELTIGATSRSELDDARRAADDMPNVAYILLGGKRPAAFDAVVGEAASSASRTSALDAAVHAAAPGAPVLLAAAGVDAEMRLLFAVWGRSALDEPGDVAAALAQCGASDVGVIPCDAFGGALALGFAPGTTAPGASGPHVCVGAADEGAAFGLSQADFLPPVSDLDSPIADVDAGSTLWVLPPTMEEFDSEALARRVEDIRAVLQARYAAQGTAPTIIVTRGALSGVSEAAAIERGVYGFARVAINEFPTLDIRLIDCDEDASSLDLPKALAAAGDELELRVDARRVRAHRVLRGMVAGSELNEGQRSVLALSQPGKFDGLVWRTKARTELAAGEVEVEVCATGLNYRDVLVAQGILDDDLLGAGLTQASLGFECSGVITRVGAGVARLKPGDRVMGFAANAFSSHVVAPEWHFLNVPDNVPLEAAAAVPVAFATAWHSLRHRAHLTACDDVLIHGAAGGVGFAATQIAKLVGARVIGTASSDARRLVASLAGADSTAESRAGRFVDPIRAEFGGVDVVLNSIAGSGMLASLDLVKPFGRFIELGKRDYLENTPMGLRPFLRNLTYAGVDLDELLAHDQSLVQAMMAEIAEAFAKGQLSSPPYQVYEASEAADAFRAMQASEHIGKIVVRPSRVGADDHDGIEFKVRPGAYLIVGGTQGFGFATAQWLARRGASTLVLASRRGEIAPDLQDEVDRLTSSGVRVLIEPLDVTDFEQVRALVRRIAREHAPLRGVVHTAVHLDDGLIASLEPVRLRTSLRAKVDGARNLDRASADQDLDFFVLYSSATTLVGSPGQSAYVAANAFLEGLARRRRHQGKPALAIGWGAISDAGIIARDRKLAQRLRQTTGVIGIPAHEALAQLGRLLALGDRAQPIEFYTNVAPSAAARKLTLLNSPTFAPLDLVRASEEGGEGGLLEQLKGKSEAEALEIVRTTLRREVAHILRVPADRVDEGRPLADMGFDSLMSLELHMTLEKLCDAQLPMVGAADRTLADIAHAIASQLSAARDDDPAANEEAQIVSLVRRHTTAVISHEEARRLRETAVDSLGGAA